ncbi:mechanosensitive ion channel family protein [Methyloprofundus sedimenti]|uniref:Small-conductance mechanosensitive channel n=1 Tax=Methyloprofundus sedimenti TaxID=1420851 RepID=A0A1V8M193_9GAMM|nr:mechanosensitive ion channel domain-containing protein [Methyloprofundus sedimenti]OQK15329.1 mechanosensitive ion channel family protein [Methyloprofundus sedimenti]
MMFTKQLAVGFVMFCLLWIVPVQAEIDLSENPVGQKSIDVKELGFRLTPLSQDDLKAAADHWQDLLQSHLQEISELNIQIAQADATQKEVMLEQLKLLKEQQIKLTDRINLILHQLQSKGGDVTDYETYLGAVSAVKFEAKDSTVLLASITGWLESPEGGIRWAINFGLFFVTLFIFSLLVGVFSRITEKAVRRLKSTSSLLQEFFVGMVRNLTKLIGIMIALSMLEVNVAPLIAALGAVGFIVGFALQGTLSNFASGLMILIYRPYDIGNVVNVAGMTGTVNSMTLVSTTLKLPDNQTVVIPNNSIWGSTITNVTGSKTRRVDMIFGIGYNDDIAKAETVLLDILQQHPLVHKDPEPVIKVHELADSSVNFVVRPWANTSDYFAVYWDVTRAVKDRFDAENISIPYPQRDVHVHTVETSA